MSKNRSGYALRTFQDDPSDPNTLVRRGEKYTAESETRWKDLESNGIVGDKPPPRQETARRGRPAQVSARPDGFVRGEEALRQPTRQERRAARSLDDVTPEEAFGVLQRAGYVPEEVTFEEFDRAARDAGALSTAGGRSAVTDAGGVVSPNAHGLTTLGEEFERTGEGRTQRADMSGQGDGSGTPPDPTPEEQAAGAPSASETTAARSDANAEAAAAQAESPITTATASAPAQRPTADTPEASSKPKRGQRAAGK